MARQYRKTEEEVPVMARQYKKTEEEVPTLETNHFVIKLSKPIYRYIVTITPHGNGRLDKRELFNQFFNNPRAAVYHASGNAMYIPYELFDARIRNQLYTLEVNVSNAGEPLTQTLDSIFKEISRAKNHLNTPRGRFQFGSDLAEHGDPGVDPQIWNGYFRSVHPCIVDNRPQLCLVFDTSRLSVYPRIPVTTYVTGRLGLRPNVLANNLEAVQECLRDNRIRIVTTHTNNNRKYRVRSLVNDHTYRFDYEGEQVTVEEYYMRRYPHTAANGHQYNQILPYVNVSNNAQSPHYLLMEFCKVVERPHSYEPLGLDTCAQRRRRIEQVFQRMRYNEHDYCRELGIYLESQPMRVKYEVLEHPTVHFEDDGASSVYPKQGRWSLGRRKFRNGAEIKSWACVNCSSLSDNRARGFCRDLMNTCKQHGMVVRQNDVRVTKSLNANTTAELVLVIINNNRGANEYSDVKRTCDRQGVVSQCIRAQKCVAPTMSNIAMKINAKLGGQNWVVENSLLEEAPTIVFGADVTHPSPEDKKGHSIAAVVASMDLDVTKYAGVVRKQAEARTEIIYDLGDMVKDLLLKFKTKNGIPKRLLFYRDGVSDGEFGHVKGIELKAIDKACHDTFQTSIPITLLVVQKRHHTRFFDGNQNASPGTIVEEGICTGEDSNFYLCSHAAIEGTARPAHYYVLHDDNKIPIHDLQQLTFNLCHTYFRSCRSVSYATPAYYAHRLADRARLVLDDSGQPQIHPNLLSTMFYL